MAYRRYGRRNYGRRYGRRSGAIGATAVRTIVKRELYAQAEVKEYLWNQGGTDITTSGDMIELTEGISQGTDTDDRIGNMVKMKSIRIRGSVFVGNNSAGTNLIRIMVVRGPIERLDVTEMPGVYGPINQDLYSVAYDKMISLQLTEGGHRQYPINIAINCKRMEAHWNPIDDVALNGHWYLYAVSDQSAGSGTTRPSWSAGGSSYFTDV